MVDWLIFYGKLVGKYTSPMDPSWDGKLMGIGVPLFGHPWGIPMDDSSDDKPNQLLGTC